MIILHQKIRKKDWETLQKITPELILVRKNAMYDWLNIPKNWEKSQWIFDGSNGVKRIQKLKKDIPKNLKAHYTQEQGAFILNYF